MSQPGQYGPPTGVSGTAAAATGARLRVGIVNETSAIRAAQAGPHRRIVGQGYERAKGATRAPSVVLRPGPRDLRGDRGLQLALDLEQAVAELVLLVAEVVDPAVD